MPASIVILHPQTAILENLKQAIDQYLLKTNAHHPAFQSLQIIAFQKHFDLSQNLSVMLDSVDVFPRLLILHEEKSLDLLPLVEQIKAHPQAVFCGIIILGNHEENRKQYIKAGVLLYLTYPFNAEQILGESQRIILNTTPTSDLGILPAKIAKAIDVVWLKLYDLNYYQILELTPECTIQEIQDRYHQRSLVLHPDRHRDLKKLHPYTYDKINQIYKKINEAYHVLSDEHKRLYYQLLLIKGKKQYEEADELISKCLEDLSESDQRNLILSLIYRYQGQVLEAVDLLKVIVQSNPLQVEVANLLNYYQKILMLF